jgi:Tol biopolymer transport system component
MLWRIDDSGAGEPEPIPASADEARFPMAARGPSGRTRIVFEQRLRNSNIWRQQLNADRAKSGAALPERLIASTRVDSSPQISPDGRRIVFASDRSGYDEIWIADADGANQKALTNMRVHLTGSPRWSPDSRRIAFDALSKKGRALFLIDSAGGEPRQWTPWGDEARPSWSRDGRWIYYGASDSAAKLQVWKISTADRAVQQVTRDGGFEAYESLDGRTLYYNSGVELRRMPVEGGNWTRVSDTPINKGWWSVSAGGIYFTGFPPLSPPPNGPFPVFFLDPISGSVRQVTSIDGPLTRSNPDFTVSADGTTLLYSRPEILTSQIRMLEVQP